MNWLRNILYAYGTVNVLGGFFAYFRLGSVASIVAGAAFGLAIIVLASQTVQRPGFAFRTLGLVVFGLLGLWIFRIAGAQVAEHTSLIVPALNIGLAGIVLGLMLGAHFTAVSKSRAA